MKPLTTAVAVGISLQIPPFWRRLYSNETGLLFAPCSLRFAYLTKRSRRKRPPTHEAFRQDQRGCRYIELGGL
jgi:hypothetical protein